MRYRVEVQVVYGREVWKVLDSMHGTSRALVCRCDTSQSAHRIANLLERDSTVPAFDCRHCGALTFGEPCACNRLETVKISATGGLWYWHRRVGGDYDGGGVFGPFSSEAEARLDADERGPDPLKPRGVK